MCKCFSLAAASWLKRPYQGIGVIQAHPKWLGPADATLSRGEQADVAIASDSDNEGESKRLLK